jgi:hypothetical protein
VTSLRDDASTEEIVAAYDEIEQQVLADLETTSDPHIRMLYGLMVDTCRLWKQMLGKHPYPGPRKRGETIVVKRPGSC